MNFPGKIPTAFLVMNECITSKKKLPKLYKGQHFFGFQLARAAPALCRAGGKPTTWFPPGTRRVQLTLEICFMGSCSNINFKIQEFYSEFS